jgi:hypothetical protein
MVLWAVNQSQETERSVRRQLSFAEAVRFMKKNWYRRRIFVSFEDKHQTVQARIENAYLYVADSSKKPELLTQVYANHVLQTILRHTEGHRSGVIIGCSSMEYQVAEV